MNIFKKLFAKATTPQEPKEFICAKCVNIHNGYDNDNRDGLVVGGVYFVDRIEVGNWHTDVYLRGKKLPYNSVMFEFYKGTDLQNLHSVNVYAMSPSELYALNA